MSEPRTSYETSVKLKEAGAPQSAGPYWTSRSSAKKGKTPISPPRLMRTHSSPLDAPFHSRAFTAGELIEMLGAREYRIDRSELSVMVTLWETDEYDSCEEDADSLVEALAAVVLEVKPWEK